MDLNSKLLSYKNNLDKHMIINKEMNFREIDTLVFDIEACAINNHTEMLTYSIACISCFDENDVMHWYNDVEKFLDMLLNADSKYIKIYAHNCLYDIKPFILKFVEKYGNNEVEVKTYTKKEYDKYEKVEKTVKYKSFKQNKLNPYEYNLAMKEGIFYGLKIQTENHVVEFLDSFKILPLSLQKACKGFLKLNLSKDGLDYDKERTLNEKLTKEELSYIYDDVFGLKYLIKLCCIDGFEALGKHIRYTKTTSSSQALFDYKRTLLEDYENKANSFKDDNFFDYVDTNLMKTNFFRTKNFEEKLEILFTTIFPIQSCFMDNWERKSYYGGLCTPHYENVEKFSKRKDKRGKVYDVNSLYPSMMLSKLLPFGEGQYNEKAYKNMSNKYKENYPLYIQDITIYDFEVKKNKMAFVQVKENEFFNGREILKNNYKDGQAIEINLRLTNVLLDLLFENYNVHAFKLGGHIAFRGANNLFKNYIDFWSEVKKADRIEKSAKYSTAKLRQNGLYGKFGMSCSNEITHFKNNDGVFTIEHTKEFYVSNSIYLPMATFITSYSKEFLVNCINNNYDRFMYCDTDSVHLFGTEEAKGIDIHPSNYNCWDNEMNFTDFKYLSPKRYAEKDSKTGKWEIKCCGLSDNIMKKVDDIDIFSICEYDSKTINKMFKNEMIYKKDDKDDVYYYKDKDCTKKIKGLFKSKKSKIIKNGTDIQEQPYMISKNNYI